MSLTNRDIAEIFGNIADILEIQGESKFKFLSYRRASEELAELPRDLQAYLDDGTLRDIPGVGKAISDKITELLQTGTMDYYEQRKSEVPLGVVEIKRINGVGPKKAKLFWDELDITSIADLKQAGEAGQLQGLAGMGKKSEQKVLEGIAAIARRSDRTPIGKARPAAERILEFLMALPDVEDGIIAGSIRRARTTIGDVDILIASDNAQPIMDAVVNMDEVARVLGHGDTKSSVELHTGLQVDVRVLPKQRWGTALQYFTGSQAHNIKIREIAREQGYSLNEDALRPIDEDGNLLDESHYVYCATESDVYETIGLEWIPPELREDSGEIEQAKNKALPRLIVVSDIIADLHMHTTYSDGKLSILEMANAAKQRGMQYICITDHSQMQAQAGGLKAEEVLEQQAAVRKVNDEIDGIVVLHGSEVDIKADGSLDFDDDVLAQLDWVVASPHVALRQEKDAYTARLVKAIANPHVDCIGHPTGRLISRREPAKLDIDAIIAAAAQHNTALELNANPERLDLDALYIKLAVEQGVLISINTDAHDDWMMDLRDYGVNNGRRGWLTADTVINTWSYDVFSQWLADRQPA
ncbi:MAG: DNA polymerase/3'-5' exonuclease PolX [Phototrophicaceae bacterium]